MRRSYEWRAAARAVGILSLPVVFGCVIPLSSSSDAPGGNGVVPVEGGSSDGGPARAEGGGTMPPPAGSWSNVTANLAKMASECGNMTSVFSKPGEDLLIAGIALKGLWGSRDGGGSWQALGTGAGSSTITNRPLSMVFDPLDSNRYWEDGLYNGGGVYETTDDGVTFVQLGTVGHGDLVSVDLSDPNRQTLVAGGHEMAQTVYRSTNGGMAWTPIGASLPTGANCTYPLVIDPQTYLIGCNGYGGGPSGVFRTTDGGTTWTMVTASGGASAPLRASSDRSIYWISPEGNAMTRSTDNGQTWKDVVGSGVLAATAPIELPDGRLAAIGPESATPYIQVSADHGATWTPKTAALPYSDAAGVTYSSTRKAFYIWHFTCASSTDPIPADAIMSFAFDYQKN